MAGVGPQIRAGLFLFGGNLMDNRLHLADDEGRRMEPQAALTAIFELLSKLDVNSCPAAPLDPALPAENKSQWMKRVRAHWRARQDIKAALGFKVEEDEGEAS